MAPSPPAGPGSSAARSSPRFDHRSVIPGCGARRRRTPDAGVRRPVQPCGGTPQWTRQQLGARRIRQFLAVRRPRGATSRRIVCGPTIPGSTGRVIDGLHDYALRRCEDRPHLPHSVRQVRRDMAVLRLGDAPPEPRPTIEPTVICNRTITESYRNGAGGARELRAGSARGRARSVRSSWPTGRRVLPAASLRPRAGRCSSGLP